MRPADYLDGVRSELAAGGRPLISIRELIGLWGAQQRTKKTVAKVRAGLARARLRTEPDFAERPLDTMVNFELRDVNTSEDHAVSTSNPLRSLEAAIESLGAIRMEDLPGPADGDARADDTISSFWDLSGTEAAAGHQPATGVLASLGAAWTTPIFQFSLGQQFPDDPRVVRMVALTPPNLCWSASLEENEFGDLDLQFIARLPCGETESTYEDLLWEVLDDARSLAKSVADLVDDSPIAQHEITSPAVSLEEVLAELSSLVGLDAVGQQVQDMMAAAEVHNARLAAGLPSREFSPHLIFTGNPGTGKTTVARLIAQLYRSLGLLPSGHLVEVSRADLVGQYVGHTEERTRGCIQRAIGGVLFIDEAYALAGRGERDFGQEAIDVLLVEMENRRGDFALIVAGYESQMKVFIESNPGLRSRFDQTIHFRDYTTEELVKIFLQRATADEYVLAEGTLDAVSSCLGRADRGGGFSNGRLVRRLFDRVRANQHRRISREGTFDVESLRLVLPEDVPLLDDLQPSPRPPIGFGRWSSNHQ